MSEPTIEPYPMLQRDRGTPSLAYMTRDLHFAGVRRRGRWLLVSPTEAGTRHLKTYGLAGARFKTLKAARVALSQSAAHVTLPRVTGISGAWIEQSSESVITDALHSLGVA
jgi:hypothetical protein